MPSERIQRQIDSLLDEAEAAIAEGNWDLVRLRAGAVLRLDDENEDTRTYLNAAEQDDATVAGSGGAKAPPRAEQAAGRPAGRT